MKTMLVSWVVQAALWAALFVIACTTAFVLWTIEEK